MRPAVEARAAIEAEYRARTARSAALHQDALRLFPGGVTRSVTFHPPYPTYLAEGCGCRVTDADGNHYLDLLNNYGSMIHGHAHPAVVAAVQAQVARGTDWGTPTELHLTLAQLITSRVPSVERIRFTNSGTEAVLHAIRAARAFTGRTRILKMEGSYHGGYDSVVVSVNPGVSPPEFPEGKSGSPGLAAGTVADTLVAPFNDRERATALIRAHRQELAAVLVEPVTVRGMIAAEPEFLRALRDATMEASIPLIVDEVVTFRLAPGGAQEHYGIRPDLTTFGKIIGGGLPVGAFGGRADIMAGFDPSRAEPVHHSGTFAGNAATAVAGIAALNAFGAPEIERTNRAGDRLRDGLRAALRQRGRAGQVTGVGSLVGLHFSSEPVRDYRSSTRAGKESLRWLHLALLNAGVFTRAGSFFLSTAVTDQDVQEAIEASGHALDQCAPILSEEHPS